MTINFGTPLVVVLTRPEQYAPYRAIVTFVQDVYSFKGENMSATMQVGSRATVSVEWKDSGGNSVKVDGPTVWESTDPTIVEVAVASGNPSIANLFAPGPIGNAEVHATADADLGDGVKSVTAKLLIEVIKGEAVGGDITFSSAGAKAAPRAR